MLHKLLTSDFSFLTDYFPEDTPNLAFVNAARERKITANVWMGKEKTVCLLSTPYFCFINGNLNEDYFKAAIEILKSNNSSAMLILPKRMNVE